MKKYLTGILIVLLAFIALMSLTACSNDSIVGTWEISNDMSTLTYRFDRDGVGSITITDTNNNILHFTEFNWSVSENLLNMVVENCSNDTATFEVVGNELHLNRDMPGAIPLRRVSR